MNRTLVFPVLMILLNAGAVIMYVSDGDWKRAVYWAGVTVCNVALAL